MSFLLWRGQVEPGRCVLSPTRIKNVGKLHAGAAVPPDFGQPIQYKMSERFPDDIDLSDTYEIADQIVVSSILRQEIEPLLPAQRVQFLPVKIINHKGRAEDAQYFILHPHDVVDCIDLKASQVKFNPLDKQEILNCKGLVIRAEAVPQELNVFRLEHWGSKLLVRAALAQRLEQKRFVGLRFVAPDRYTGIG